MSKSGEVQCIRVYHEHIEACSLPRGFFNIKYMIFINKLPT